MSKLRLATVVLSLSMLSAPTLAQSGRFEPFDSQRNTPWTSNRSGNYYAPRPAVGPYDRPTLNNPAPVIYGKKPTLGDPRPYRKTNPRTCFSLLCD